jgi:hypothetical protein
MCSPVKKDKWVQSHRVNSSMFRYLISEWTLMSISDPFRYRSDSFQSNIFSSNIGVTDVDVGCRMSDIVDIKIDVDAHLDWNICRLPGAMLPSDKTGACALACWLQYTILSLLMCRLPGAVSAAKGSVCANMLSAVCSFAARVYAGHHRDSASTDRHSTSRKYNNSHFSLDKERVTFPIYFIPNRLRKVA